PGDPMEVRQATRAIVNWPGPCYLRLGKGGEPIAHHAEPAFTIGKSIVVREGNDVTLISTGGILSEVISAAEQLAPQIQARVLSVPTVKPLDEAALLKAARETSLLITVEEHSEVGGLGSAVSQVLSANSMAKGFNFLMLSLNDALQQTAGSQRYFRKLSGLDSAQIAQTVREHLDEMLGSSSQAPSFIV
ncbi:MAG: transketolase, partial [Planctomycetes bacterium]|nr:transketolase [Planctomycetota bacterium]